jgi:tRNA pseudouridine55 synthase
MDGIINVFKPEGMTSFGVVSEIRRLTGTKKVGHAGTLDPDAVGVLPVCVGKATKVIEFMIDKDKSYRVELILGKATDTQDKSGRIIYEKPVSSSFQEIKEVIESFTGNQEQIPPMYSAVRINGKKLYQLARKGIEIERKPRKVTFYKITVLDIARVGDCVNVLMDADCSKGTYIRTLCHDIGQKLGCGGHMGRLIRTRSGSFLLDDAYTLETLKRLSEQQKISAALLGMDKAVLHFPAISVSEPQAKKLKNGLSIRYDNLENSFHRIYDKEKNFLAIGKAIIDNSELRLKTYKWIGQGSYME